MANVNILNLPVAIALDGTEYTPVVQGETTKRAASGLFMAGAASTSIQNANTVLAGPTSGSPAAPTFRNLTSADFSGIVWEPAEGGTGIASYAIGDLIYASGATTLAKLAGVATGNALISGGVTTAPSWGKIGLTTHVSGTLPVASGGTGVTSSTGTVAVVLSDGPTLNSPTFVTPALGTPASGTLTNCTGLPVATGISGLGTNVATFLATPSSSNLASAVTDETGSGSLVFGTSPTLVTPTFTTSATVPIVYGGTANGSALVLTSTSSGTPAADYVSTVVGGAEAWRTVNGGQIIVGYTASVTTGVTGNFQMHGATAAKSSFVNARWQNAAGGAGNILVKSRSGTIGLNAIVQNGDTLGFVSFVGDDGASFITGANITAQVDGTPGISDMPTLLAFSTTQNGSGSVTERMRIDNAGNVIVNTAALVTTATDGFLYIPSCPGTPTGVPTSYTGRLPMVFDSTNNRLYIYDGSWISAAFA